MISISISINQKDRIQGYKLEGHANYAEEGEDIVCAAVSVLAQTALLSLNKVGKIEEEKLNYKIDEEIGYLEVILPSYLDRDRASKAETILRTFELGIKSIIESYPKYITLEYRRCS